MAVYKLLPDEYVFPDPNYAEPNGLLAVDGDLHPQRVVNAYFQGIFPWYSEGERIKWFFPQPRCVLNPKNVKIYKSMRSYLNSSQFRIKADFAFENVLKSCARIKRPSQGGTWITSDLFNTMSELHNLGIAHSIEVYEQDDLVGGLYGLALGKMFCGESMFAYKSNCSKLALIHLCRFLEYMGFDLLDCQQETPHLLSMGAHLISKDEFISYLETNASNGLTQERWSEKFEEYISSHKPPPRL